MKNPEVQHPGQLPADDYPRDQDGHPVGNYVQADDTRRPTFRGPFKGIVGSPSAPVILIIGAGFTGVSAALRLGELQRASGIPVRIVLVEADRVASGPSGKNAGHICGLQLPDAAVRRHCGQALGDRLIAAATDAADLVRALIADWSIPCDLRDGYVSIDND